MIEAKTLTRACGSCSKCCEGWLTGQAYGFEFHANKPCAFLGVNGCNIYVNRPYNPCKTFQCEWTINHSLPEWLKPDRSKVIASRRIIGDYSFLMIVPAGAPVSKRVHAWAEAYSKQDVKNHVLIVGDVSRVYSQDKKFGYVMGVEDFGV